MFDEEELTIQSVYNSDGFLSNTYGMKFNSYICSYLTLYYLPVYGHLDTKHFWSLNKICLAGFLLDFE